MLLASKIALRARHDSDVPVLQAELYDDVATRSRADSRPWRPISPGSAESPYAVAAPSDEAACFSVVELPSGELAGEALLWGIDTHNRTAHLGIALRPAFRGRGLAREVVGTLCHYGFTVRGLHRLQVDTLADNAPMIAAATGAGFVLEGTLRRSAWTYGAYSDEVVLGLLAEEWTSGH
ncbi:GNAT family N-acetyltransferase [Kitasatospora sp. RG8]|uniref:GNAT family N-acetyltransferase n=1 Tax=Kitasatospora sp. RG8 TaxID=2820815 RepID=UPI001ADEDCCE|nr:GNAT family protein [Kitasatospora sp. RG8]MBP0454196.1 GNAT family N-acetyltransferase [Kitasatospora sp. RG8]